MVDVVDSCAYTSHSHRAVVSLSSHLKDAFGEARLLRQLLQIFGIRVLVEREVALHGSQLVVFEAGAHPLTALTVWPR